MKLQKRIDKNSYKDLMLVLNEICKEKMFAIENVSEILVVRKKYNQKLLKTSNDVLI